MMQSPLPRISVLGEAMLELSHRNHSRVQLSYGGDTLNTAVYLARFGYAPNYITALGRDPYSDWLLQAWQKEGVCTDRVLRHPDRLPGLYAIQNDERGERRFFYWRDASAARALFKLDGIDQVCEYAAQSDYLYLSGISLSIYSPADQAKLVTITKKVRQRDGTVVFDPNYRPNGWDDIDAARDAMNEIAPYVSIVMPTLDDEQLLFGEADTLSHAMRWLQRGVDTVVIKDGARGAFVYQRDGSVRTVAVVESPEQVVDTTGAGDSFNAAFLAAYIKGASMEQAAQAGHELAVKVIQYPGAIIPLDAMVGSLQPHRQQRK